MAEKPPFTSPAEVSAIAQAVTRSVLLDAEEKETIESSDRILVLNQATQSLEFVPASDILETAEQALGGLAGKVDKATGKSLVNDTEIARLAGVTNQTKADIGLDKVSNLLPSEMPVSIAQQTAINQVTAGSISVGPTDDPVANINAYKPIVAATYSKLGGIVVSAQDMLDGDVQILRSTTGAWSKKVVAVPSNVALKADLQYKGTFDSIALALAGVPLAQRKLGDTVGIKENGSVVEYWWGEGLEDYNLVKYISFTVASPNVINYRTDFKPGGYLTTGAVSASDNQIRVDLIPVNPDWIGEEMTLSGFGTLNNSLNRIVALNAAGTVVHSIPAANSDLTPVVFTPASDWANIRINIVNQLGIGLTPTVNAYTSTLQLQVGELTVFKPYGTMIEGSAVIGLDEFFASADKLTAVENKIDAISIESYNLLNKDLFISGSWNTSGSHSASNNSIKMPLYKLPEGIDDFVLSGYGPTSISNARIILIAADGATVLEVILSKGTSDLSAVQFSKGEAKYVKINIANVVGIGLTPTDNAYTGTIMLQDATIDSEFMPFGEVIDGSKIVGLKMPKYDLNEIVVEKISSTILYLYYHKGVNPALWGRIKLLRRVNGPNFVDSWGFDEVWVCERSGNNFAPIMEVVKEGVWENAIYTSGSGYSNAVGASHGWEMLVQNTIMIDNAVIDPLGVEAIGYKWYGGALRMMQNSNFKTVDGSSNIATSTKGWLLENGNIYIGNKVVWHGVLNVLWNSYLSMLSVLRIGDDGTTQITTTAIPNDDMMRYDVSTEGFITAITNTNSANGSMNPDRTKITIFGDKIIAEVEILKREVTLADGTFLPKGFNKAPYAIASMYVQNSALYNKVYGAFGGNLTANTEKWDTLTRYSIAVSND